MNDKLAKQLNGAMKKYPHQLEQGFPHIVDKITAHWDAKTLDAYLESLLFDTRGNRSGFSTDVLSEIFALQNHYRAQQPPKARSIDTWGDLISL
jgi:hypothetical protein